MEVGIEIRQTIQDLYERIEATKAATQADEDAERVRKKAVKDAERDRETLRKAREREEEQRQRAAERLKDAELAEELSEITRVAVEMADSIGTAFEDIISGTESVAASFGTMVEEILKQVQRLLIQKFIVEPIVGAILGKWGPGSGTVAPAHSMPEGIENIDRNIRTADASGSPGFRTRTDTSLTSLALSGGVGRNASLLSAAPTSASLASAPRVIVQQSITVAPQLINARDAQRFIEEQGPTIAKIVGDSARHSSAYASSLR